MCAQSLIHNYCDECVMASHPDTQLWLARADGPFGSAVGAPGRKPAVGT